MHLTPCNLIKNTIHTLSWCRAIADGNTGVPPHSSESFTNKIIRLHHQLYMHDVEEFNGVTGRQHQSPTTYSPLLFELLLASPDPHHSLVADITLTRHSFLSLSHFLLKPCCNHPQPHPPPLYSPPPLQGVFESAGPQVRMFHRVTQINVLCPCCSEAWAAWWLPLGGREGQEVKDRWEHSKPRSIFFTLTQVVLTTMSQRSFPGIMCQFPSQ